MKRRKVAALFMTMLLTVSMAACGTGGSSDKENGDGADGEKKVELRWLNKCESEAEAEIWQQLADNVTAEYPDITITIENTDWTSYWTKLPVELASGNAPDLLYMHFSRASDYKDSMLPLNSYIEKDEDINMDDYHRSTGCPA